MTLLHRSLVAIAISASLAGCYTDVDATVPMPENPEPMQPLPAEKISLEIGDSIIDAMKESVVITTLEGEEKRVNVETFKGIEYATQTRFAHSITKELEENVNATAFGDACMQVRSTIQDQSEDCLNLNIWRPAGADAGENLPVYVFIHGGDFEYGSGSEVLVHGDTVVAQGSDDSKPFIYISLNYRLGQLGTQWVKGTNVDGNYGLGDQKRALEWVHDNIASFGGDIDNVTVIGQGSGAMSVGLLQQDDNISGNYFQRAIMQSNPYGFEYPSYDVAKDRSQEFTAETSIDEIMASQKTALNGLEQLKNWLLSSLSLSVSVPVPLVPDIEIGPKSDNTPMSTLMPFAPYIQCEKTSLLGSCSESAKSPMQTELTVPSVLGNNASEANSFGMLFSVTFLIPTIIELITDEEPALVENVEPKALAMNLVEWLDDAENQAKVERELSQMDTNDLATNAGLSLTAYSAVTQLFWGLDTFIDIDDAALDCLSEEDTLGILSCVVAATSIELTGHDEVKTALNLTDFYPNSEAALGGATANMAQFKTMLNDTLFNGPARHMAANSTEAATLYRFDKKPSFNMWNYNTAQDEETGQYGELSILDLFKTIGCISGACNGSELPFMFNKAVRFDGSEIHPNTGEKALMNEMSRLWFSEELFTNYQYSDSADNVLVIEAEGFSDTTTYDWDYVTNPGVDPKLRQGRLTGLEEQGLMPWQWYLN
ncbi:para-nitrobenzyl esterase [Vibrio breoganii]|uniref:carboxylesterase family protein n=1 Tax=Vibrio breoganii TaxID=553239 RepID=UPI0002EC034C|nr:carboxylesterase family protein [Vibrio breoganii]MDN3717801.1 carboxylesterase family protein [Vibrio breoganii]OED92931.1 para-nitrobenzyl esterase [Vibrio breoganii ZF-55]OEF86787.1 para-nitrobenzyl esterase [Vibrio breoganii 1C10]PMG87493.1 para-nitrobenzyl esterase [Vibrio breoganii]PML04494.1 para-nitrobenzyl esterase [Vibrio breoganii]